MNRRPSQSRNDYDSFASKRTARFTAASPDAHFFDPRRKMRLGLRAALAALAAVLLVLAGNFAVNRFVHVRRETVPVKGLPAEFEG